MSLSITERFYVGIIVIMLLFGTLCFFYYQSVQNSIKAAEEVQRSQQLIQRLESIVSLLKDAETGQRGYIITGKINYLEPYQMAIDSLDVVIPAFERQLVQRPAMAVRWEEVKPVISRKIELIEQTNTFIRLGNAQGIDEFFRSELGKATMDSIRFMVNRMSVLEDKRLEKMAIQQEIASERTFIAVTCSILFTSLLLFAGGLQTFSDLKKKQLLEEELTQKNKQLSSANREISTFNEELQTTNEQLHNNNEQLYSLNVFHQKILDNSYVMVMTTDLHRTITTFNKAAEEMLGYRAEELIGKETPDLFHDREEDSALLHYAEKSVQNWSAEQKAQRPAFRKQHSPTEVAYVRKDGSRLPVLLYISPLEDMYGNFNGYLGMAIDISKRKEAEEKLNQVLQELERANKDLESFSYSISHDLRAPLRAISSYTGILLHEFAEKMDEEGRKFLTKIEENSLYMGKLIDDLLLFARLGQKSLRKIPFRMQSLVEKVVAKQTEVTGTQAYIRVNPLPRVIADPDLLEQVWVNLISNAIKFSSKAQHPEIRIDCQNLTHETVFSIRDNGIGFDLNYAKKLFGVFQRLHKWQEYEGTGVGLAIVKRIVEAHQGRVWAESEEGKGATFYFTLPDAYEE